MIGGRQVRMEVDLGLKAVEKVDIYIYVNDELVATYADKSYYDLRPLAEELRGKYQVADIEAWASGQDCLIRPHRWKIEV